MSWQEFRAQWRPWSWVDNVIVIAVLLFTGLILRSCQ